MEDFRLQPEPIQQVDSLLHARWIIPVEPKNQILEDHCVVINKGKIIAIVPQQEANKCFSSNNHVRLENHALIPGFVNAHGHAAMTLFRGIADDLELHDWLENHIWPLENRWVSEEFVLHGARVAIAEMIRGGTTCFADMYFFPDATARAAIQANIRVQLAAPVLDFPTAWANDADEYIHKSTVLHDQYRNSELLSTAFGPHAPYTVSDAPLRKIAMLAEELDLPVHMHVHETAQEVSDALAASGKRPLQRLYELGLLSPRLLCVHATQLLDEEIRLLAENGCSIVHCPESNMKLASGFCPVQKLLDHGINVALGTDGAASNNDLDMFSEMRSAALLGKAVAADATAVSAAVALQMATLNGARALGLSDIIGSLEVGKAADITAVRLDTLNSAPVYNAISQLVYSTQANQVSHVWVGGRITLDEGKLTTMNIQALQEQTESWRNRILYS
jgi:5-methylthioadenosine/S-adenosylhomocysteine deaminase